MSDDQIDRSRNEHVRRPMASVVVGVLVGVVGLSVPVWVIARLGTPWPSSSAWRDAWSDRRVSPSFAVAIGEATFLGLWTWALFTWLASLSSAVRDRRSARSSYPAPEADPVDVRADVAGIRRPVEHLPVPSWHDVGPLFGGWSEEVAVAGEPLPGWEPSAVEHRAALEPSGAAEPGEDPPARWTEPEWHVLVTVLGLVSAVDRDGRRATFEKSRSLELLIWLTQHRERPTRGAARTALWDRSVKDSTFANIVSDLRRGLARLVPPPDGGEWVGRTLTDDLPLDALVVTDAELLQARLHAARSMPPEDAVRVLRPGLALVTGMPFSGAGTSFGWADGEGHTTAAVLLITTAATELAAHLLRLDDIDGVFWATGQGLKVLPGHEELIALRMQAHAARGDLAGVRLEWEQYERSVALDPWEQGSPSPKLASLRRDLLSAGAPRGG